MNAGLKVFIHALALAVAFAAVAGCTDDRAATGGGIGEQQSELQAADPERTAADHGQLAAQAGPNGRLGVLVHVAPGTNRGPLKALVAANGAKVDYEYTLLPNLIAVSGLPSAALAGLASTPGVTRLEAERIHKTQMQQSLPLMQASVAALAAAGVTNDGAGTLVCIIDTGLNKAHPCFPAGKVVAEKDFVNNDLDATDDNGHGSHVAAIAACDGLTYPGVAPKAQLAIAKVLDAGGSGSTANIIAAIQWCAAQGADVMNLSIGGGKSMGDCDGDSEAAAIAAAAQGGTAAAVAASNDAWTNAVAYPACAPRAITVGAVYDANLGAKAWSACSDTTTAADKVTCFSDKSPTVDVSAPGSVITAADLTTGWTDKSGTSMAAPHVAGLIALMRAADPLLSVDDIRDRLWKNSDDRGTAGFDDAHGHGRVNGVSILTQGAPVTCITGADCGATTACSGWACSGGFCVAAPVCNDNNPCTTDTCNAGACTYPAASANDGLACTADTCDACFGPTNVPTTAACGDTCAGAVRMRVGQTLTASTKSRAKNLSTTCPSGWLQRGPDLVYKVALRANEAVRIRATPTTAWDPGLYVLMPTATGDCNIARCAAGVDVGRTSATETLDAFRAPVDGDYFVVVDAYSSNGAGAFTLSITPVCHPEEAGRPCDDRNACTSNDTCKPDGACSGS